MCLCARFGEVILPSVLLVHCLQHCCHGERAERSGEGASVRARAHIKERESVCIHVWLNTVGHQQL